MKGSKNMMALPKILLKLFQPRCRHIPGMYATIEDGTLTEPGGEPRKVKIRMGSVKCERCDRVFKLIPMGVAHDPVKEIHMEKDEPLERHVELDEEDTKKLIEDLASEGIRV